MGKSAAQIAQELAAQKKGTRNLHTDDVEVADDEVGGITEEAPAPVAPSRFLTGTPFDLVKGRPNVDYWGPFAAYHFVTTAHGEYAIPEGQIMRFEYRDEFDVKSQQVVTRAYPKYEDAPAELMDYIRDAEPVSA